MTFKSNLAFFAFFEGESLIFVLDYAFKRFLAGHCYEILAYREKFWEYKSTLIKKNSVIQSIFIGKTSVLFILDAILVNIDELFIEKINKSCLFKSDDRLFLIYNNSNLKVTKKWTLALTLFLLRKELNRSVPPRKFLLIKKQPAK